MALLQTCKNLVFSGLKTLKKSEEQPGS